MTRIHEIRLATGLSMRETARRLDIPYTTYVNYEKHQREPNSESLIKIAKFFGVTVDYLIGNDPPEGAKKRPAPEKGGQKRNIIKMAGRDGQYVEQELSDNQLQMFRTILSQLPDVTGNESGDSR